MPFLVSRAGVARGTLSRVLAADAPRAIATSAAVWQKQAKGKPAAPAGAEDDIVIVAFKEQQRHFRELVEGSKSIPLPLSGDDAAIKKYAEQMQALKKKIGIPDVDEKLDATLDYKLRAAGFNVRSYLRSAVEGMELGSDMAGVITQVYAAVDAIEAKTGAPLDQSNKKGWDMLRAQVAEIAKKAGLDNAEAVKNEAVLEMYKGQIAELKSKVEDDMEMVKRREGLDWVNIDLGQLKLKAA